MDARATFAVAARTVRVPVSVLDKGPAGAGAARRRTSQISEDGKRQDVTLLQRRAAPAAHRAGPRREPEHGEQDPPGRGGAPPFHRPARAGRRDPGHHVQRPPSRRPGLHVRSRAARPRARQPGAVGGATALYDAAYEAIQRVATGAGGEQGRRPRHRRRRHGERASPSTSCASSPGARRCRSSRSGSTAGADREDLPSAPAQGSGRRPAADGPDPVRAADPDAAGRVGEDAAACRAAATAAEARASPDRAGGFDAKPLLELADDTGGRAEIVRGPASTTRRATTFPGRTASSRRSSRSR